VSDTAHTDDAAHHAADRRSVLVDAVSIGLAVGAYGLSFGALSITAGLDLAQSIALSALMFTGASQFAFIGVVGGGGSTLAAIVTAWFLGIRNGMYGLSLAPILKVTGARRLLAAQIVLDESTAMTITRPRAATARMAFWATGISVFICWNVATVLGALGAQHLGDPRKFGLDAAIGAAFLALLWPRLSDPTARLTALLGAVVALALTPVLPRGVPILVAAGVAVIIAWPTPKGDR
jgi:predicted branched-subunit amino acid permease